MITETRGDIFHSDCDAIVIPTNCQGVMGAGLAKQFRDRHPALAERYKFAAQRGELRIGVVTGERSSVARRNYIFFPTKDQWWFPSKLSYISQGLIALRQYVSESPIRSIALPALGCGLGELDFYHVKEQIYNKLQHVQDKTWVLYVPSEYALS